MHGAALVGRRREVELLAAALDRSRRDRDPELATIVGVPGIGKSRLVVELMPSRRRSSDLGCRFFAAPRCGWGSLRVAATMAVVVALVA